MKQDALAFRDADDFVRGISPPTAAAERMS